MILRRQNQKIIGEILGSHFVKMVKISIKKWNKEEWILKFETESISCYYGKNLIWLILRGFFDYYLR